MNRIGRGDRIDDIASILAELDMHRFLFLDEVSPELEWDMDIHTKIFISRCKKNNLNYLLKNTYNRIKKQAKERKYEFNLSYVDAMWVFIEQYGNCAYSNRSLTHYHQTSDGFLGDASLDRTDNTKGYTYDNIQWIHKDLNIIKHRLHESEFISLIERTYYNIQQLKQKGLICAE